MGTIVDFFISPKKDKTPKLGQFSSVLEAKEYYTEQVTAALYENIFFSIRVRCKNCKKRGTFRLFKGTVAEGAECPICGVEGDLGLAVLGVGTKNIVYTPAVNEEVDKIIEDQVKELIESGLSEGLIVRAGDLFI